MPNKLKSKLTPLVESLSDYENCIIIRLKPNSGAELVKIGYFSGTERQLRIYKFRWLNPDVPVCGRPDKGLYFDVWMSAGPQYKASCYLTKSEGVAQEAGVTAILDCLEDFGVSLWMDVAPKGENVPSPSQSDNSKASIRVGGLFQLDVEFCSGTTAQTTGWKVSAVSVDPVYHPFSQSLFVSRAMVGDTLPCNRDLPRITVHAYTSHEELERRSRYAN